MANISHVLYRNTEVDKVAELGPREDAVRSFIKAFETNFNFDICEPALVLVLQAIYALIWNDNSVILLAKNRNLIKYVKIFKDKVADSVSKDVCSDLIMYLN